MAGAHCTRPTPYNIINDVCTCSREMGMAISEIINKNTIILIFKQFSSSFIQLALAPLLPPGPFQPWLYCMGGQNNWMTKMNFHNQDQLPIIFLLPCLCVLFAQCRTMHGVHEYCMFPFICSLSAGWLCQPQHKAAAAAGLLKVFICCLSVRLTLI